MARTAVVAGTATAVSNRVSRCQAGRWAQQEQPQQYQEPPPQYQQPAPAPTPSPDTGDMIEQLKQLAELKEQGVLTDAEFAEQKSRILGA